MSFLNKPGYSNGVENLILDGWVLRCGHCRRVLATDFARSTHRVFDDLSGRCLVRKDVKPIPTNFFADPRKEGVYLE